MSGGTLSLLHMLPDARLLAAWVARHHVRHERQASDLGDVFHGLLRAAFGDDAPQPFRYLDQHAGLLAYTSMNAESVRAHVALADPLVAQTLGLGATDTHGGFQMRPLPAHWSAGQVLAFEVRVRPTVRTAKGERDAFLRAADQDPDAPIQRDAVYLQWLREHLAARTGEDSQAWHGAIEVLDDTRVASFQRIRIVRRMQGSDGEARRTQVIDGPDAVLMGHLRVIDPAAFARLLARGVGRHRAFGFGMLLLRRAAC
jgi:CRISPR system Cascade subunit CasE